MEVNNDDELNKRHSVFAENMDVVLEMVNGVHKRIVDVKEFDMVFLNLSYYTMCTLSLSRTLLIFSSRILQFVFPVYNASHHYIICYNMKKPSWEIIDNRVHSESFANMFGDLPNDLVKFYINAARFVASYILITVVLKSMDECSTIL